MRSSILLVVGRGSHFQNGEEGFLRDVHLADALHAALAFFLLFEEFAFARDVSAIAFGENVLRMAATVSRAITRLPIAAWIGTSNIAAESVFANVSPNRARAPSQNRDG